MLSLANGACDGVYSKRFMGFSKTQKTGIDLFLISKERFFFAIYLFFDTIKLTLAVCSPCVHLCMTCFFIKNYGGGWELCGGGGGWGGGGGGGGEACVGSKSDKNLIT